MTTTEHLVYLSTPPPAPLHPREQRALVELLYWPPAGALALQVRARVQGVGRLALEIDGQPVDSGAVGAGDLRLIGALAGQPCVWLRVVATAGTTDNNAPALRLEGFQVNCLVNPAQAIQDVPERAAAA